MALASKRLRIGPTRFDELTFTQRNQSVSLRLFEKGGTAAESSRLVVVVGSEAGSLVFAGERERAAKPSLLRVVLGYLPLRTIVRSS